MTMGWNCLTGLSLEATARDVAMLATCASRFAPDTIVAIPSLPDEDDAERLRAVAEVRALGFTPMPHVAARRLTSLASLERLLAGWADSARVDRLLVLAGDCAEPSGEFPDALSVIRTGLFGQYGIRQVVIAGYPEGHGKITVPKLEQAMHDKLAALAAQGLGAEIATQFCFSAQSVLAWLSRLRTREITVPVRLGIPGPATLRTLLRYAALCGVAASASVLARYGVSLARLNNRAGPDTLVRDLADSLTPVRHGEVLAHFYPFGGMEGLCAWLDRQTRLQVPLAKVEFS